MSKIFKEVRAVTDIYLRAIMLRRCEIDIVSNENVQINEVNFVKRVGLMWFTMIFKSLDDLNFHTLLYSLA